jgi:hypothetical protein
MNADLTTSQVLVDPVELRRIVEHTYAQGFTDGLPVVPATAFELAAFLAVTERAPDEVVAAMPHLNKTCDVTTAAINAIMAGCTPELFPVVLAALDALSSDLGARASTRFSSGLWQSTTGSAPLLVINGPARRSLGFNCEGNIFGPGFRANATVGRALRLIGLNAFGLTPHVLDQATHSTPGKYTCCFGENEELSPWDPLSFEAGYDAHTSTVSLMMMRSTLHVEARSATTPEQLLYDIADSIARTSALYSETNACCVVMGPEHANMIAAYGWSKDDVRAFLVEHALCTKAALERAGKTGVSRDMRWLVPSDHPDAIPGETPRFLMRDGVEVHPVLSSIEDVVLVVAGAPNAGVSTICDLMGASTSPSGMAGGRRVPAIAEIKPARRRTAS